MNIEDQIPPSQEQIEAKQRALNDEQQEIEHINNQNKTIMNTGTFTSKVASVTDTKEWGEGDRKTIYHNLVMENGDKINIGKKKNLQPGDTISYEVTEVGQQEYCKSKSWNPDYNNNGGQNNSSPQKTSGSQQASFALSYAKDSICTHGLPTGTEPTIDNIAGAIHGLADKHLEWLNENSK